MLKMIFVSLPVANLDASVAFYKALGFEQNPQFSDASAACMVWSEAIQAMLISHAKWRMLTQRPFPPPGSCGSMLSLTLDSRAAVDAMNLAAASHGGQADVNPAEDMGFMYTRDIADPDGHMWAALWMDPAATQQNGDAK
jgi:predicted lactoylglutathione lyase